MGRTRAEVFGLRRGRGRLIMSLLIEPQQNHFEAVIIEGPRRGEIITIQPDGNEVASDEDWDAVLEMLQGISLGLQNAVDAMKGANDRLQKWSDRL